MSTESPGDLPKAPTDRRQADGAAHPEATILVRGESIGDQPPKTPANAPPANAQPANVPASNALPAKDKPSSPPKAVSEAKVKMQSRLPALDDDADVGVRKEYIVIRDGKADVAFTGTLLGSAAPSPPTNGHWQEYRVYETTGGKHVFSKVNRSVYAEDQDGHQAEVFEPSPSSVPSQLLRTARDLTRSHPLTWMDAAVAFFGYDPLAKTLYRKLSGQFEEHIS
jgi:hypothetical protein